MKIVQIVNSVSGGGAEALAVKLHAFYANKGIEAKLIDLQSTAYRSPYRLAAVLGLIRTIRKLSLKDDDVIHVHLFPAQLYTALLAKFGIIRGRLFTTEHSTWNRRRRHRWWRMAERWVYRQYDGIFCISDACQKGLNDWVGPIDKIEVIYNGIDLERFSRPRTEKNKEFKILSIGALTHRKNYPLMIELLSDCKDLNWHWFIAGTGSLRKNLEEKIYKSGLTNKVTFLGQTDNIENQLADADVLLHLPKWEGFGLVIVEAMAARCPVFTHSVFGMNEVIRESYQEGIFADTSDTKATVQQLRDVISGQINLSLITENAHRRAKEFSFEKMANNYLAKFENPS